MPDTPDISVVIPVRNGAISLPPLLESLQAQTLPAERFEVIVVDNGSTDSGAAVARAQGARVVCDRVPNRSRARNLGVASARAPLIAFTDADCVADPGWLETLLGCGLRALLVAGPVRVTTAHPPNAVERFEALWRFGQEAWVKDGWAATANLLVHRQAFDDVGGFDEAYRHIGEDVDFCVRSRDAGYTLEYCEGALVTHGAENRLRPLLERSYRHGYSVNQTFYRLGVGYRAWRRPRALLDGEVALKVLGAARGDMAGPERQRMAWLARAAYAARMAGSLWADVRRAR